MYRFLITIVLLLGTAATNYALSRPEGDIPFRPLKEFPQVIGSWKMVDEQTIGETSMAILQVDDYIMRSYANKKGEVVGLYIGYFKNQREGKQSHSPRLCLPGGGWNIITHYEVNVAHKESNSQSVVANAHLMGKGEHRELFIWWFFGRGRIIANEYYNKLYLIWDSITRRRTDGGLVRFNIPVASGDLENPPESVIEFIGLVTPLIVDYIPK